MPSNRYQRIAPEIQDLFDRYGLHYVTGSMPHQVASAWSKVIRLSLPNQVLDALGDGDITAVVRHLANPVGDDDAVPAAA
jgi:hypothetical protein